MTSPALNRLSSATLNRSLITRDFVYQPEQSDVELKAATTRLRSSVQNQVYSNMNEDGAQTRYNQQSQKDKSECIMVAKAKADAKGNAV